MSNYRDIVIAGGGMVGVSLALQLAHSLQKTCNHQHRDTNPE